MIGRAGADRGGSITGGDAKSVTVVGSLSGGAANYSGSILLGEAGSVKVGGGLTGQTGTTLSGSIDATSVVSLDIGGSLSHAVLSIGNQFSSEVALTTKTLHIGGSLADPCSTSATSNWRTSRSARCRSTATGRAAVSSPAR